jgi:hypothetical protein
MVINYLLDIVILLATAVLALAEAIAILLLAIIGGRYLLQPILHRVTGARNRGMTVQTPMQKKRTKSLSRIPSLSR